MIFDPAYKFYKDIPEVKYCFLYNNDKILIKKENNQYQIPKLNNTEYNSLSPVNIYYIGSLDNIPCFAGEIQYNNLVNDYFLTGMRELFSLIDENLFQICGRGLHYIYWSKNNKFCGNCGSQLFNSNEDHSKICNNCKLIVYPRISPAIITAVVKENKILLGKGKRFKYDFYSVLAGFVEPGESLEECVVREIYEEAGIKVKNIKYFGSQPWPFPDSLMIAFTSEYESGELIIDQKELIDAKWFTKNELPKIPGKISIAGKLIEWFINNY